MPETDQYIPSIEELKGAKLVEDSLMRLLVLARKSSDGSPEAKEKTQAVFGSYRKLQRKLREAAGRTPELQEQFDILARPLKKSVSFSQPTPAKPEQKSPLEKAPEVPVPTLLSETAPTFFINNLGPASRPGLISKSAEVGLLQAFLGFLGFGISEVTETFDEQTTKILKSFQMKAKLPITGQVDLKTRKNLNLRLSKITPKLAERLERELNPRELYADLKAALALAPPPQSKPNQEEAKPFFGPADHAGAISSGDKVTFIQEALLLKGYDVQVTGDYDKKTFAAVRSVQAKNRLKVTGTLLEEHLGIFESVIEAHQATLVLKSELNTLRQDFSEKYGYEWSELKALIFKLLLEQYLLLEPQGEKTTDLPGLADRVYLSQTLGNKGQQGIVSEGIEVTRLQEALQSQGLDIQVTDVFDLQTFTALKAFQKEQGLYDSGIADAQTHQAIYPILEKRYDHEAFEHQFLSLLAHHWERLTPEIYKATETLTDQFLTLLKADPDQPEDFQTVGVPLELEVDLSPPGRGKVNEGLPVLRLQLILNQCGENLTLTAHYDDDTLAAVRRFQTQQKLPLTGNVDLKTRQKLNALDPSQTEGMD